MTKYVPIKCPNPECGATEKFAIDVQASAMFILQEDGSYKPTRLSADGLTDEPQTWCEACGDWFSEHEAVLDVHLHEIKMD